MKLDQKLHKLLKDYDYVFSGNLLIRKGIKGYTSDEVIVKFKDIQSAAEWLCPIIKDDKYTERLNKLTSGI